MLTLDLFNTRHEKELHEGAVDNTIARLIEPLSLRAADIRTQLRNGNLSPAQVKALEAEYEDLVAKRLDIIHGKKPETQDECMGYGSLVGEAGLPDVADKQAKMARLNQPGKVGSDVVTPQQRVNPNPNKGIIGHAKDWLTGKGGPGKEGPTYESELDEVDAGNKPFELTAQTPESAGQAVYQQLIQAYKAEVPYVIIPFMEEQKQATLTKPSIFNALVALYQMNPNARKKAIEKNFSTFENFMLFVSRLKPYQYRRPSAEHRASVQQQTSPSPSPHPEPQQTGTTQPDARQWQPFKDLSESAGQKKNSQEPDLSGKTARDPVVARELRKMRGRQPSAASDIEALVRDEMDQAARTEQQLAQHESEIDRQQQQLTQLVQTNQTQSSEITSQGREIDNLYKQLRQVPPTTVAQPAPEPKAEPSYAPEPVPAEVAAQDAEARAEIVQLNKQIQQLQQASAVKPPDQQKQSQAQIDQLQGRIDELEKERAERVAKQKAAAEKRAKTVADKKSAQDQMDQLFGRMRLEPASTKKIKNEPVASNVTSINSKKATKQARATQQAQADQMAAEGKQIPLAETIEPGAEMTTNELLYRAAVEYMQQMGREGQAVDFETAVKLAARHYHIPYRPGMVPELYAKRAELDAKLAAAIAAKQAERAGRKQRRVAQTAPTTPEQEKKMQDYWAKNAPRADRIKPAGSTLEEGYYKNLDIERQERNLGPIYEVGRRKDGRWTPLKQYNDYAQAQAHAQNIKNKYPSMEVGIKSQDGQITMVGLKEGYQDFNKVEPYEVCLAGKCVKTFDYYEDARRFHDNWKKKLYNQGEKEKADKITLNPIMKEATNRHFGPKGAGTELARQIRANGDTNWTNNLSKDQIDKLAGPRYPKRPKIQVKKNKGVAEAQLDELSPETLKSYIKKSKGHSQKYDQLGNKADEKGNEELANKMWNKGDNRYAGDAQARNKLADLKDKKKGVTEGETDYSKRRQREKDIDAGKPVARQPQNPQTDYTRKRAKRREQDRIEGLREESSTSSEEVESAILKRIMVAHLDLLKEFGPEKVMQAVEEVAYGVGDLDEIGTSDVSGWVHQVKDILGVPDDSFDDADEFGMPGSEFFPDDQLDEKWSAKYKSSIDCSHPKGFSQRAHCAGRKK